MVPLKIWKTSQKVSVDLRIFITVQTLWRDITGQSTSHNKNRHQMNNFAQQPGHQKTLPQQRAKMGHLSVIITQVQHEIDTKEINKTKNIHHIISTIACNNMNIGRETSTQYLQCLL